MWGIAYQVVGGPRFYERAEIRDVLAYLRVATNPADAVGVRQSQADPSDGQILVPQLTAGLLDQLIQAAFHMVAVVGIIAEFPGLNNPRQRLRDGTDR